MTGNVQVRIVVKIMSIVVAGTIVLAVSKPPQISVRAGMSVMSCRTVVREALKEYC